ncbi:MAG: ferric reductase-like transmembrane domain-containing protein, partial [Ectothiorhodospiraceae bacterium]|nr:ferric reductase-like transmembrane domain-containing protein [Ectothiorhodospiraceae bacterium]
RSDARRLGVFLLLLYLFLILLPVILAALQGREPRPWRDDLASGLAMAGFAMLLAEFLLSGRSRRLSARVGMDVVMRFHQFMGHALLLFLLFHPFLYSLPMNVQPYGEPDAATWLSLPLWPGVTGLLAWMGLGLLVLLAVARDALPFRYEAWRFWHGFGALVIALFALHHTLAVGRYSQEPLLAAFWWVATALAVLALLHVHLWTPLRQRRRPYRVTSLDRAADRTWVVELEPDKAAGHDGSAFPYRAGQFAWLKLKRPLFRITEHPFSLSSAPAASAQLEFTIKEAGDFTSRIGELPLGTRAYLDGPYGNFTLEEGDARPLVLIAGGVGMAPIMSLLRQLKASGSLRSIVLLQANRHEGQILYRTELAEMAQSMPLRVHYMLAEPPANWPDLSGIPDGDALEQLLPEEQRRSSVYYVCGPAAMIDVIEAALDHRFRVPAEQVCSERFRYSFGARAGSAGRALLAFSAITLVALGAVLAFALR